MSESTNCPTCGSAVRVVGHTTLHYEPMPDPRDAALALVRELAGRNPLVPDDTFAVCGLCRAEAGGSAHDPRDFPHAPGCLWVAARALVTQADAHVAHDAMPAGDAVRGEGRSDA